MHKYFADWYRFSTSGQASVDQLTARWSGVDKLKDGKLVDGLTLLRIAMGNLQVADALKDSFRKPFKDADPTFLMSGNDLELSVLAGSVVGVMFDKSSPGADQIALGLVVLSFQTDRVPGWCIQFVELAKAYLSKRLTERRLAKEITVPGGVPQTFKAAIDAVATQLTANSPTESGNSFTKFGDALISLISNLSKQTGTALRGLESELNLRREECEVLWWMTSRVSRDMNKSFEVLDLPVSAFVMPKELADLVSPPGVLAAEGILAFLLTPLMTAAAKKQISISSALKALPDEWLAEINLSVAESGVRDICPVLGAIDYRLKGAKWESQYKNDTGFDPNRKVDTVQFAMQVHRECLLSNILL